MENSHSKPSTAALFQVYLRLRPPQNASLLYPTLPTNAERFLTVENSTNEAPTHIILNPPNDNRRRAIERFGFTKVFEEEASQLDVFQEAGVVPLVQGVLGPNGGDGRDGLLATLGVTGSGKSHTILGSRSQRGLTQLSLDVLYRSISDNILGPNSEASHVSIASSDPSEAQVLTAQGFLDLLYGDLFGQSRASSRAPTPMGDSLPPPTPRRTAQRLSPQPTNPDVSFITLDADPNAQYAVVVSMYEVYNDRIFDLLTPASKGASAKDYRRRPLLFKSTEQSQDRKVVAGLRKIICSSAREALMVLDAGLQERRIAQTGSNNVSSRSHGFFCVEVKKRSRGKSDRAWSGSTLTIVDLAGSERARDAKTQGATLAEAGKINESLMYLGQCLQMQSDIGSGNTKPNLVPFRQCKLTELLFSNSFPSSYSSSASQFHTSQHHRNPQRGVMIVTADPMGDFNATSQILRYSALAREITVPRVPSVTATILGKASNYFRGGCTSPTSSDGGLSSNNSVTSHDRETMEIAAMEIARMSEEMDSLRQELELEHQRRVELEAHLLSSEERVMEVESEVREECYQEMESTMKREMAKWKAAWAEEMDRNDEHLDRKIEILSRSIDICEDENNERVSKASELQVEELEDENEKLRCQVAQLMREVGAKSPTKPSFSATNPRTTRERAQSRVLRESANGMNYLGASTSSSSSATASATLSSNLEKLRLDDKVENGAVGEVGDVKRSPSKKFRKFTARKWDVAGEDDELF